MVNQEVEKTNVIYNGVNHEITIFILDGTYFLSFFIESEEHNIKMYPASKDVSLYIEDLAQWLAYDYIAQYELDTIMDHVV